MSKTLYVHPLTAIKILFDSNLVIDELSRLDLSNEIVNEFVSRTYSPYYGMFKIIEDYYIPRDQAYLVDYSIYPMITF